MTDTITERSKAAGPRLPGAGSLAAIVLMVAAMAGFAVADTFIKLATAELPTGQIIAILGFGGIAVFATLARRKGYALLSRDVLHPAILVRMGAEAVGTLGFVFALTLTTLSTASAVSQATPLVVTLGAALVLREPVGWRRWGAVLVGFAGVLVMLQPDGSGLNVGALLALVGTAGLSVRDLSTRFVPAHIPNLLLATYGFSALVPTGLAVMAIEGGARMPSPQAAWLLAGMIGFAASGYFALTASLRLGDVSAVTPFRYTRLIFAFALGTAVFGERLTPPVLVGALLVAAAGLYTLYRERKVRIARRASAP